MKFLKKLLIAVLALLVLACVASWFYLCSSGTDYNLKASLSGLTDEVEVYFDEYAIPHIYAENEEDAYRAFGYVHANERLWQMELVRRIGPGKLSEVFGAATLETDKFFRTIGMADYTKASVRHLQEDMEPAIRNNVMAYIDGINQFIENGDTPLEYSILGLEKTPFTPEDLYNTMGYMAFSFAMAHKTEPILTHVLEKHGAEYLQDLMIEVDSNNTLIHSGKGQVAMEALSLQVDKIMDEFPVSPLIGSNSWIVGGTKSKNGKVLFANDPHIGFSQPSVWYEGHLNTPDLNLYGYWLAGFPFPQLIHTEHHAIGLTMFENDDIDFFREKTIADKPGEYFYQNEWLPFETRKEVIKVKDAEDVEMTVRNTVHGPIMNDAIKGLENNEPVSMWWTYLLHKSMTVEAGYKLHKAKSMEEAKEAAALVHAPGLNVMYGDVDGNIAWWAVGKLPIRPDHVNSKLILDGTGKDDPLGYYDFSENPQAENPESGYVYSANNQSVSPTGKFHPGYYLPEDRARRIVQLMEAKDDWTADDFKKMLLDVTSNNAPEVATDLVSGIAKEGLTDLESGVLSMLSKWDGEYGLTQTEPTVYSKLLYQVSHSVFSDEMGEELFDVFNGTHLMKRSFQPLFANVTSKWWDDITTPDKTETRQQILTSCFKAAVSELTEQFGDDPQKWQWGEAHTLEHNHSFSAVPSLKEYFNVGPFPMAGNTETINNQHCKLQPDGTYEVFAGPSTRRIVDFADVAGNSWSILPTGQSGNVMSDHYSDQAGMYVKGEFRRMLMGKEEIVERASAKMVFSTKLN